MKVFILGHKGMLGRYVYSYFKQQNFDVVGVDKNIIDASNTTKEKLSAILLLTLKAKKGDVFINCAGTIKPMVDKHGSLNAIQVNSVFPHLLSSSCKDNGFNMIHITTDCVYSGKKGLYTEDDLHDCTDVYGKSKSLGEPSDCTVLRTSIIGEEIGQARSFIEWIKSSKDKTVNGFINHNWNGVTCLQVAKIFENIILNDKYWNGVQIVTSPNIINKCDMVKLISDTYNLNITVTPVEDKNPIDRTMESKYINNFNIPALEQQIKELKEFYQYL